MFWEYLILRPTLQYFQLFFSAIKLQSWHSKIVFRKHFKHRMGIVEKKHCNSQKLAVIFRAPYQIDFRAKKFDLDFNVGIVEREKECE